MAISDPSGAPRSSGAHEIIAMSAEYCIARCDAVQVCIWRSAVTLQALEIARRSAEAIVAEHGALGLLGVAEEGLPLIGAQERKFATKALTEMRHQLAFVATVIEGDGFWASTSRSVMTAISMLARPPCPTYIFRQVGDAAAWQSRHASGALPITLTGFVERCRSQMDTAPRAQRTAIR